MTPTLSTREQAKALNAIKARAHNGIIVGDVDVSGWGVRKLPDLSQYRVTGCFDCGCNRLESLVGSPHAVDRDFHCDSNPGLSLVGSPDYVGGSFYCESCKLTTLAGAPRRIIGSLEYEDNPVYGNEGEAEAKVFRRLGRSRSVEEARSTRAAPLRMTPLQQGIVNLIFSRVRDGVIHGDVSFDGVHFDRLPDLSRYVVQGDFDVGLCELASLVGSPKEVAGALICQHNKLKNFVGAPKIVGGSVYCWMSGLMSLNGSPEYVGGNFIVDNNRIRSLVGSPKVVGKVFQCSNNALKSLRGISPKIGGEIKYRGNPVYGNESDEDQKILRGLAKSALAEDLVGRLLR